MGLRPADLELLIEAFEASPWTEMIVTVHGARVELTSTGSPPAVAPGPPARLAQPSGAAGTAVPSPEPAGASPAAAPGAGIAAPTGPPRGDHEVRAPSVGIFYRAPAPGAPPFVQEGARVAADDIVCIVEVMKLMNHVRAEVAGVVRSVHAEDATMIEHGQLLFTIDTAA